MAESTVQIKVPDDIEYRVIGYAFGFLISCGGLLAGSMFEERSLEYWAEDIVPLFFAFYTGIRLFRSFVTTLTAYHDTVPQRRRPAPQQRERMQGEHAAVAQLPQTPSYTPEQVVEEVAKRIESQRAEAARKGATGP